VADILITHTWHLPYDPKQFHRMQPYLPLGTLYAATALRDSGFSVAAFDSMLSEPSQNIDAALATHRPKILVVYEDDFNFLSKMCLTRMREVAWEIARAAERIGAVAVVHGSDSTDNPGLFLENGFRYVLCGEAESSLTGLCRALLDGEQPTLIAGLSTRDERGKLVHSSERLARNPSWTDLSLPARDLVDIETYRSAWIDAHGYFSTNMVASRGCPFHCNWCAKPISGNRFQLRPPASVAEEMHLLKFSVGVDHIWFGDDVFALNHHWMRELAVEVERRDAAVPFKIQSRADLMTEETVLHLKAAGCSEVWMGVESGSQTVLNAMDKGLNIPAVIAARGRLGRAGIQACYFLQFGYPGESWDELQQTIAFVRKTRPDDIGVSFSYPLPGTLFYARVQEQLGSKRNWTDSDDLCIMFQAAYTTEFYRAVRDALHAEVDSWKQSRRDAGSLQLLWRRVAELEPLCRNEDALRLAPHPSILPALVPLDELLAPRRA